MNLCSEPSCRLEDGHDGEHSPYPTAAWSFLAAKDKNKITKAGFATPRGGAKGAYQKHVLRSNKVIIPYERFSVAPKETYEDGYVVRIFPEQYFDEPGISKPEFFLESAPKVGVDAFILYRNYDQLENFPPLEGWSVRSLELDGEKVDARHPGVEDRGEYVLRITAQGSKPKREEGPPQGIFAPEYATAEANYISKCVLAWLSVHTVDSPYVDSQSEWLEAILRREGILDVLAWERLGLIRSGHTACPLCMGLIKYNELHDTVNFSDESSLMNASEQVLNTTRSTIVNLFHVRPLVYSDVEHGPKNVAWGHAVCNTKLGQRRCFSIAELIEEGEKVATVDRHGIARTFGWIASNLEMIRSPRGAVWIRISDDRLTEEEQAHIYELLDGGESLPNGE